jgi:YidC/Oxa1 family membrane protein insertase
MDRNSLIGLLLIGVIMIASTYYFKPEPEAPEAVKKTQVDSSNAATEKGQLNGSAATEIPPATEIGVNSWNAPTTDSSAADTFILENEKIKIFFLAKGGMPVKAVLKEHLTWQKKTLTLFNNNQLYFRFPAYLGINGTHQIQFIPKPVNTNQLDFNAQAADGSTIALNWTLKPNSYQASLESGFNFKENTNQIGSSNVNLRWISNAPGKEKNRQNERDNATVYYKSTGTGEVDKLNPLGFDSLAATEQFSWIAFKQQFFTSAILPQKPLLSGGLIATRSGSNAEDVKTFTANFNIDQKLSDRTPLKIDFYFGPTHYSTLKEAGQDLQLQIPLGWGIFGWVNKFLVIPVFNWLDTYGLNYGIVILFLTIIIKLILFPFQFKSYLSQAKMRVLKPEMDELNKKYENEDPLKKQQALMALYKEAGVNPLGGCFPLLLQLPILLAMFNFFPNAIELRQQSFLWADDLSTFDSILTLPFSIPVYGDHVSLFALLMTISTIIYTMMNNSLSVQNEQMKQMKWMMYLMPVVFLLVLNSYAAGLNYYYFLANIITFGQQFAFTKLVDEKKIHAKIQANKLKPASQKTSSFQQKLEEMAKKRGYNPPKK